MNSTEQKQNIAMVLIYDEMQKSGDAYLECACRIIESQRAEIQRLEAKIKELEDKLEDAQYEAMEAAEMAAYDD